jgi:hypothetical protein
MRYRRIRTLAIALLTIQICSAAAAAGADSRYLQTDADISVAGKRQVLLEATVAGSQNIYLQADGGFHSQNEGQASVFISIDDKRVSNTSLIDWSNSKHPVNHSFRAVSAVNLAKGRHKVQLIAVGSALFIVGKGANLSMLTRPANFVESKFADSDLEVGDLHTTDIKNGYDPLPTVPVIKIDVPMLPGPVISLASGRSYYAGSKATEYGDAMWSLSFGNKLEDNNSSSYSDNDICLCAETQAPMFLQGNFSGDTAGAGRTLALLGSVEPWGKTPENGLRYKVGRDTALVALAGGMTVVGKIALLSADKATQFNRTAYYCVASSVNWSGCPPVGSDAIIAKGSLTVPQDHNGIVMFTASLRLQGGTGDQGGLFHLWLTIDGKKVGTEGLQELAEHSTVSTRTVSASYLSAGGDILAPGLHVLELHGMAQGGFKHLAVTRDMPLMWFD